MSQCPLDCINSACSQPDFIERNGAWLLTVTGVIATCVGGMFTYFLKSRCKHIRVCGMECERDVVSLQVIEPVQTTEA